MKNTQSKPYVIYSRKSTDDLDNQKNSIPYQVEACAALAKSKNLPVSSLTEEGFITDGIIREKHTAFKTSDITVTKEGQVNFKIERPKFNILIQKLLSGEFAGIICLCWDRISRNEQDGILIKQLMDNGIDFQFVQVTYDKTSSGALHRDIDGMFASHYSRVISEKVRNTFEKFRKDGRCIGPAPIGSLDNGSDDKPLDPERAPLVKRVFELYATGEWSLSQLGKWANKSGLTSKPSRAKRTREEILAGEEDNRPKVSRPVNEKTIENILKNPFYIGKHRSKSGEIWDCNHPRLIDTSLFNAVQQQLKARNVTVHYVDKEFYTYRGLIRCECGRSYSPYEKKGNTYYRCRCKETCTNPNVNIREDAIHKQIMAFLDRIYFTDEELAEIEAGAKTGLDKISEKRNNELTDLERERKRIYGDLDYMKKNKITLLRNNVSTIDEYSKDVERLEQELSVNAQKMEIYRESEHEMLKYVITFSELVKMASEYYKHALDSEKREIVAQVFSELILFDLSFQFIPKDGFSALFLRHEQNKSAQTTLDATSCSGGGVRTHGQAINSRLLYR